jgi:hypothetical protein
MKKKKVKKKKKEELLSKGKGSSLLVNCTFALPPRYTVNLMCKNATIPSNRWIIFKTQLASAIPLTRFAKAWTDSGLWKTWERSRLPQNPVLGWVETS